MVWKCRASFCIFANAGDHEPRRQNCHVRHSTGDIAIDWNEVIFKGLVIKGIYGREMFETWYKMASLLQSGLDISPILTHEMSVDDFEKGFETMISGQSGKVILNWD